MLSDLSVFFGPRLALDGFLLNCSPSLTRLLAFFQAVAVSAGRVPLTGRSARPGLCCRSRCEVAPRCSLYAKPRIFGAHRRGS